jgi:acyl-CoA synthetase (AMP-forming)/AMP-acid ligase II
MQPSDVAAASPGLRGLVAVRAQETPERVFVENVRDDSALTYRELEVAVAAWSADLAGLTIEPGASVLLIVEDPIAFSAAYVAVIASGRCVVPVNPAAPDAEIARTIAACAPALALADRPEGRSELGVATVTVAAGTGLPRNAIRPPVPAADPVPGALRLSTSGSTGAPKIVEITERQLLHTAGAIAEHNRLTAADRGFCPLPLFHINAEVVGLLSTLVAGATIVLDDRFHRTDFWSTLEERRITWLNAVPAMYAILDREPIPVAPNLLRFVRSASAPLPAALREKLQAALGIPVVESYGMTEAASQITAMPLDGSGPAGSAGRPIATELEVRASSGAIAADGEVGRVWIRGAGVIRGYVDERAADRFDDAGWLDTGDVGWSDAEGYLYLSGRADDVINRGGELIYPREIEEVLLSDPRVMEAVVVGRPDDILGAVAVALIMPVGSDDSVSATDDLIADLEYRCRFALSPFKRPTAFEIIRELPRSATGKVQTHRLRVSARA